MDSSKGLGTARVAGTAPAGYPYGGRRALPDLAVDPQGATVQAYQRIDERQAEPAAAGGAGKPGAGLLEGTQQPRDLGWIGADAVVDDPKDAAAVLFLDVHGNPPAGRRELTGRGDPVGLKLFPHLRIPQAPQRP